MTDHLGRKIKSLSEDVEVPDMDVDRVMARSRKRRRAQRFGTACLTLALIAGGWAIGTQIDLGTTRQPESAGSDPELEIVYSALADPESAAGETDIFAASGDGSRVVNLTDTAGSDTYPVWSPDGSQIAFVSEQSDRGNVDIYVMNADGSDVRRLTDDRAIDTQPTWSPDGDEIAFSRSERGTADIYAVNVQDSTVRRITDGDALDEEPSWSPDGLEIAFASYVEDNQEIFSVHPDGTGIRRLTTLDGADWDPAWSPDGTKLAFSRDPNQSDADRGDLYVMDVESGNIEQVTSSPAVDKSPDWSSNGTSIIFGRDYLDGTQGLFILNLSPSSDGPHGSPSELGVPTEAPSLPDWKS